MLNRLYLAALVLLATCSFPRPADVGDDVVDDAGHSDFAFTLETARVRIVEGSSATVGVNLTRHGFTEPITVTVTGLPPGVTIDPLTISGETGVLRLHVAMGARQGDTALTVMATGDTRSHDATLSLLATGLPGTLDQSFGSGGTLPTSAFGHGSAIAIQPDGKILVSGTASIDGARKFIVTRYLQNGTLDTSFSGGMVTFNSPSVLDIVTSIALHRSGKIVVATTTGGRTSRALVVRLNSDGSHDTEFGAGGEEEFTLEGADFTNAMAVAVDQDSSIIVTGDAAGAFVARLTPSGMFDSRFNVSGYNIVEALGTNARFLAVALQPDGRIVAAGFGTPPSSNSMTVFARFNRDGRLDESFSGSGSFATNINDGNFLNGASIAFQPDGKIVATGGGNILQPGGGIARLLSDGTLDTTFGIRGSIGLRLGGPSSAAAVAIQPDGKFVLAGSASVGGVQSAFAARYDIDVRLDPSFGNGGTTTPVSGSAASHFHAVALDADGRIIATGFRRGPPDFSSPDEVLLYRFWP